MVELLFIVVDLVMVDLLVTLILFLLSPATDEHELSLSAFIGVNLYFFANPYGCINCKAVE